MILAESPRLYPVFTHHAKELEAAARYLVRQMVRQAGTSEPDGKFNALLDRHRQVVRIRLRIWRRNTPRSIWIRKRKTIWTISSEKMRHR